MKNSIKDTNTHRGIWYICHKYVHIYMCVYINKYKISLHSQGITVGRIGKVYMYMCMYVCMCICVCPSPELILHIKNYIFIIFIKASGSWTNFFISSIFLI